MQKMFWGKFRIYRKLPCNFDFSTLYFLFHKKKKSGNFKNVFVVHYPIFMHSFWTLPAMTSSVDCWMRMWDCNVMQRTQPLDTKLKLKSIISSRNSNKKLVMQTFDRMSTESDIQLFIYIFRVLQNQKKY